MSPLKLLLLLPVLFLAGCATYSIEVSPSVDNSQASHYEDGVLVLTSTQPHSKVRLEIAQSKVGGANLTPLALFITTQISQNTTSTTRHNANSESTLFDIEHITLSQGGNSGEGGEIIAPISEESLKNDTLDFGTIIEAFHLYLPPKPVPEHYVGVPLIYRGFGGFGVYDYMIINAREQMQRQIKLEEQRAKRAIIIASLLRKNTLLPNAPFKGGFVLYYAKSLKPGAAQLSVRVGSEEHHFGLKISK